MKEDSKQPADSDGSLAQAFEQASSDLDAQAKALEEAKNKALEEAKTKAEEHWNLLLRARADLDNIRKQAQIDLSKERKYGIGNFATELLSVYDSVEQGLNIAKSASDAAYQQGLELIEKQLLAVFEKFSILAINPVGEQFDPTRHEAISTQVSTDLAPNHILTVVQRGFMLNDRVLRPARVIVSKGE